MNGAIVMFCILSTRNAKAAERNDFIAAHNPFLANAARCTSAFPFAFKPMRLAEIDPLRNCLPHYYS